jgi:hypothetical protein
MAFLPNCPAVERGIGVTSAAYLAASRKGAQQAPHAKFSRGAMQGWFASAIEGHARWNR